MGNRFSVNTFERKSGNVHVWVIVEDKALAEMLKKNIEKFYIDLCKNCQKPFIVNSPNHAVCERCKK